MITRPKRANSTFSVSSACVPTASAAAPDAMPFVARCAGRARLANRTPLRPRCRTGAAAARASARAARRGSRSAPSSALCMPPKCASTIAAAATSVLPLPTSPCKSRFIGALRRMSRAICSITRVCAPVGANGSSAMNRAYQPAGGSIGGAPPAASRRARLSAAASAMPKNSSKTMRRRPRSTSAGSRGAWTSNHASRSGGKSYLRTSAGGNASARAATSRLEVLRDRRADRARRQIFGRAVDRHDLADVGLVAAQFAVRGDVDLRQQPGPRDASAHEEPVAGGEAPEEMRAGRTTSPRSRRCRRPGSTVTSGNRPARSFTFSTRPTTIASPSVERRDRLRNAPVAVRARQVREQRLGRVDAEFGKLGRRRRADAGETRERLLVDRLARCAARELVADLVERDAAFGEQHERVVEQVARFPDQARRDLRSWRRSPPRSLPHRSSCRCGRRRRETAWRCSCPRAGSACRSAIVLASASIASAKRAPPGTASAPGSGTTSKKQVGAPVWQAGPSGMTRYSSASPSQSSATATRAACCPTSRPCSIARRASGCRARSIAWRASSRALRDWRTPA